LLAAPDVVATPPPPVETPAGAMVAVKVPPPVVEVPPPLA
jgi:hypothetical protein